MASEDRQIPQAGKDELMADVKVRRAIVKALLAGIGLLRSTTKRGSVEALAPTVAAVQLDAMVIHPIDMQNHGVVVSTNVWQGVEDAIKIGVPRQLRRDGIPVDVGFLNHVLVVRAPGTVERVARCEPVHVDGTNQLVASTARVGKGNKGFAEYLILHLKRIVVDVGNGH